MHKLRYVVLFFLIICFYDINAQSIYLKTPFNNTVYLVGNDSVDFCWNSPNSNSNYTIEISSNINFSPSVTFSTSFSSISLPKNICFSTTYWRIINNLLDTSSTRTFKIIDLNSYGTIYYQINGESITANSSGKVGQWDNLSSQNFSAQQTSISKQPLLKANGLNNKNYVHFGESGNQSTPLLLSNEFEIADTNFTIISNLKLDGVVSPNGQVLGGNLSGIHIGGSGAGGMIQGIIDTGINHLRKVQAPSLNWSIRSYQWNTLFFNGQKLPLPYLGTPVNYLNFNTIGLRPDNAGVYLYGNIAEIIIYNEILPDSSRLMVENYLKTKYTPYPDLGKDTLVCGPSIKIGFRTDHPYSSITWSTGQTNTDSITITQNGTYWVRVQAFDWVIRDTINIGGIVPVPQISLTNDQTICFGDSIQVNYTPVAGFIPVWSTGDTANSIVVKDATTNVSLSHYDIVGCSANSVQHTVYVDSLVLQSTLGDDRTICDGGNIFLNTSSQYGPFDYLWNTGDTIEFTNAPVFGQNEISIRLTDINNCVFRDTVLINSINLPAPTVDFLSDTACPFLPIQFTDLSVSGGTDNIVSWKWNFINGDTSAVQNPAYAFPQGVYNVGLTVETDSGCVNTIYKLARTHKQPNARFKDIVLCQNSPASFQSISTIPIPDNIVNNFWLVDGQSFTGNSINPTINQSSLSNIVLYSESDKGCLDTLEKSLEVFPEILVDFEVENICVGDTTRLINTTQSYSIIDQLWNLGLPNEFTNEIKPSYFYPNAGIYNVSLKVTNALGCTRTIEKPIEIHELPQASFTFDNSCEKQNTLFTDNSTFTGNAVKSSSLWTINESSYQLDSVNVFFNAAATVPVSYSITDNFGCSDDTATTVQINSLPDIDFSFTPTYGTAPLDVQFINQSNAIDYIWSFGDDSVSNEINPSHSYLENGLYNIVLIGVNQDGCRNELLKQINIAPSEVDVELSNLSLVKTTLLDGSTSYKAQVIVKNVGSRAITNLDLYTGVNNETKTREHWDGVLDIGDAFLYTFTSSFVISSLDLVDYICITATNVNDGSESVLYNNKVCEVQDGTFKTAPLYPNPTNNLAYLEFISKYDGICNLNIVDMLGNTVSYKPNINVGEGFNQYIIDCTTLQAGKYFIQLSFNDQTITQSLIVVNK